jgi:hypothetical protein
VNGDKLCETAVSDSTAVIEDRCVDGDTIVGGLGGTTAVAEGWRKDGDNFAAFFRLPSCLATMPSKIEPLEAFLSWFRALSFARFLKIGVPNPCCDA